MLNHIEIYACKGVIVLVSGYYNDKGYVEKMGSLSYVSFDHDDIHVGKLIRYFIEYNNPTYPTMTEKEMKKSFTSILKLLKLSYPKDFIPNTAILKLERINNNTFELDTLQKELITTIDIDTFNDTEISKELKSQLLKQNSEVNKDKLEISKLIKDIKVASKWFVDGCSSNEGISLDYSIDSLKQLDNFFDKYVENGRGKEGSPFKANLGPVIFAAGSYLGETIIKNKSGAYWDNTIEKDFDALIFLPDESKIYPMARAINRYKEGEENAFYPYGYYIINMMN